MQPILLENDELPEIFLNAWAGDGRKAVAGHMPDALRWALRGTIEAAPTFLAPKVVDLRDWRDPQVGWGLVLADGAKIPEPIERLRKHRNGAPVFRFRPKSKYAHAVLRNYEAQKDVDVNASPRGTAPGALPYYLLICGSPKEVPWRLQYVLNTNHCVGRLDLDAAGLDRYVTALIGRWETPEALRSGVRVGESLVWSVAHEEGGQGDITQLMRDAVGSPLFSRLSSDSDIGARASFLTGAEATALRLLEAVESKKPGFIVTTSHGQTGPLDDPRRMAEGLGLLVDQQYEVVDAQALAGKAHAEGAIWYAHACCSAGSDAESSFKELFEETSSAGRVLGAVAGLGSLSAPLPRALLGAERPIRAFIGHVEPTFDWTLRQPFNGQFLTSALLEALYHQLYRAAGTPTPIGHCFREWFVLTGSLLLKLTEARKAFNRGMDTENLILWCQLAARDIISTVILGDPALPLPPQ